MYQFLNIFFFVFHTVFTLFNLTGWMFRPTRKLHLACILLTACSWFILGIWFGWGYCACTDWHWEVRDKLGLSTESHSYIHFLILKLTGANLPVKLVETATLILFLCAFILSVWLNLRDYNHKKMRKN